MPSFLREYIQLISVPGREGDFLERTRARSHVLCIGRGSNAASVSQIQDVGGRIIGMMDVERPRAKALCAGIPCANVGCSILPRFFSGFPEILNIDLDPLLQLQGRTLRVTGIPDELVTLVLLRRKAFAELFTVNLDCQADALQPRRSCEAEWNGEHVRGSPARDSIALVTQVKRSPGDAHRLAEDLVLNFDNRTWSARDGRVPRVAFRLFTVLPYVALDVRCTRVITINAYAFALAGACCFGGPLPLKREQGKQHDDQA